MKKIFFTILIASFISSSAFATYAEQSKVLMQSMQQMSALWNKGDLNAFMTYYKKSAETTYITSSVMKGYDNILAKYSSSYPDKNAMGKLSTSHLELRFLTPEYALMNGKFKLIPASGKTLTGIFTLVWEKTADGWKIILDHTS